MSEKEQQLYQQIYQLKEELGGLIKEYWKLYSNPGTEFFWINILTILISFTVWFIVVDRRHIFKIAFFGYSNHILWVIVDSYLTSNNYFNHPHSLSYLLPQGTTVSTVLFPVCFMLLYQYCMKRNKNFWIYAIIGSFVFAYGFGSLADAIDMARFHQGFNLFKLSLIDVAVVFISYLMTLLFQKIQRSDK
ncbi:hypothetical protein [Virgibacillus ihumii]|uniref:hypothetical protein n=1 Tax=Virgibacillus ihumii TaxID=2686091 RepID=UPI00157DDA4E|nr:hypothetical protein [Virgibacillus ihumii]